MSRYGTQYQVGRPTGVCAATGVPLVPGAACVAALCERAEDDGFERIDYALEAWENGQRPPRLFSHWRTTVAEASERKHMLVDDEVVEDLLDRMADDERPQRVAFRFVLALILMRKRRLRFVGRAERGEGEPERWRFRRRGSNPEDPEVEVVNPELSDDAVRDLTAELGEVLQGDF